MPCPPDATQVWGYSTEPTVIAVMFDSWAAIDLIMKEQDKTFFPTSTLFCGPFVSEFKLLNRRRSSHDHSA